MLDDYELLYLAQEENEYAIEELSRKYYGLICYKANKNAIVKEDTPDLINEGLLSLHEIVNDYTDKGKTKFITYLNTCLDRKMSNYRNFQLRKKHSILNNAIPLDEELVSLDDIKYNPIQLLIEEEEYRKIKDRILKELNSKEELVFILKEQNFTVKEISSIIDIKLVEVYNLIKMIRKKINRIM